LGNKAFAWCHAVDLKSYELYDDGGDDFIAAFETSLDELTCRILATLVP
jgi:hypothetical protein